MKPYKITTCNGLTDWLIITNCIIRRDPTKIPWGAQNVETVVESTGIFTTLDKAEVQWLNSARDW